MQLIRFSLKRVSLYDSIRKNIILNSGENTPSLRIVCPTRWTVRHKSINSILQNYSVLLTALEKIQLGRNDYAAKASGLLAQMMCFDTYFALKLAYLVFSAAEQLTINLQSVNLTVQVGLDCYALICKPFAMMNILNASTTLFVKKVLFLRMIHTSLDEEKHPDSMMGEHNLIISTAPKLGIVMRTMRFCT